MSKKTRRLAIVGSRNFSDQKMMEDAVVNWMARNGICRKCLTIVSGGAQGADTLSEQLAKSLHMPTIIHRPDWGAFGRSAGFIRNQQIVDDCDYLMAFYGPPSAKSSWPSAGTTHSVDLARKAGIPYEVHYQQWRDNQNGWK